MSFAVQPYWKDAEDVLLYRCFLFFHICIFPVGFVDVFTDMGRRQISGNRQQNSTRDNGKN